jgi:CheY-like chemotaxis protein
MGLVLLASTDPAERDRIAAQLTADGHGVVTAADGLDAMTLIRRVRPDIMVLDSDLPGVTGETVWHIVRAYPSTARMPVVLLTGPAGQPPHAEPGEAYLTATLPGPTSAADIADQVRALLHRAERYGYVGPW